jgi:hypothetical protein
MERMGINKSALKLDAHDTSEFSPVPQGERPRAGGWPEAQTLAEKIEDPDIRKVKPLESQFTIRAHKSLIVEFKNLCTRSRRTYSSQLRVMMKLYKEAEDETLKRIEEEVDVEEGRL